MHILEEWSTKFLHSTSARNISNQLRSKKNGANLDENNKLTFQKKKEYKIWEGELGVTFWRGGNFLPNVL